MYDTEIILTILPDPDYNYQVVVGSEIKLVYNEYKGEHIYIGFGHIDEMEAVANAMLKAVKIAKSG